MPAPERILIIKLSALGDLVAATGHFRMLRSHHKDAHITLLTTPPFEKLARAGGWFDDVWTDGRPRSTLAYWALIARMRAARFTRVYDLQCVSRTSLMFQFLRPFAPEWVGSAWGASHRIPKQQMRAMTGYGARRALLDLAGVPPGPQIDLSWADSNPMRFDTPKPYAVLVPGAAPSRPRKRWPLESFIEVARRLRDQGIRPIVVGHTAERAAGQGLADAVPGLVNLVERTEFADLVTLGREASLVVGNDTGPMHLLAAAGAPSLVLFSGDSDPERHKPLGTHVEVLQSEPLAALSVDQVWAAIEALRHLA